MQYKPMQNYHMENVVLGKDFNLGVTGSFFHAFTHLQILNALIDDDESSLNIELGTFAKNIKKKIIVIIDYFLSFLIKYDERKTHNMVTLM
jgi:hypothetical protein